MGCFSTEYDRIFLGASPNLVFTKKFVTYCGPPEEGI
jgi:hypothetical protein